MNVLSCESVHSVAEMPYTRRDKRLRAAGEVAEHSHLAREPTTGSARQTVTVVVSRQGDFGECVCRLREPDVRKYSPMMFSN